MLANFWKSLKIYGIIIKYQHLKKFEIYFGIIKYLSSGILDCL